MKQRLTNQELTAYVEALAAEVEALEFFVLEVFACTQRERIVSEAEAETENMARDAFQLLTEITSTPVELRSELHRQHVRSFFADVALDIWFAEQPPLSRH